MISFKQLQKINNDPVKAKKYSCSKTLKQDIQFAIYDYYNISSFSDQIYDKKILTKIQQALYLVIAILNFNYLKQRQLWNVKSVEQKFSIFQKYLIHGTTLSKQILTNVITNKDLYLIKNILLKQHIIQKVEYHKKRVANRL